mmetsp:Transcript_36081/g.94464  ORF Transcript_36081/g.94464 Transcript_36081/m.94464 type:complete len:355 (-) Transcript_36081:561-1625(-)
MLQHRQSVVLEHGCALPQLQPKELVHLDQGVLLGFGSGVPHQPLQVIAELKLTEMGEPVLGVLQQVGPSAHPLNRFLAFDVPQRLHLRLQTSPSVTSNVLQLLSLCGRDQDIVATVTQLPELFVLKYSAFSDLVVSDFLQGEAPIHYRVAGAENGHLDVVNSSVRIPAHRRLLTLQHHCHPLLLVLLEDDRLHRFALLCAPGSGWLLLIRLVLHPTRHCDRRPPLLHRQLWLGFGSSISGSRFALFRTPLCCLGLHPVGEQDGGSTIRGARAAHKALELVVVEAQGVRGAGCWGGLRSHNSWTWRACEVFKIVIKQPANSDRRLERTSVSSSRRRHWHISSEVQQITCRQIGSL